MSNLLTPRKVYKPFEYPQAFQYMKLQQNSFWLPSEVSMMEDIADWKSNLSESEKQIIGQVLKSFTQTETHINEYWSSYVSKVFPKYEIQMMCSVFSSFESIHIEGYDYLNTELGIEDYEAFLSDKTALDKLDRLKEMDLSSKSSIARSLAIFSAFTEGVSLYSSFAILANLSRFNLLKNVKNIIAWSQRDEELHSVAGCWLFRTFISENPEIWTDELKKEIYEAARLTVQLEDNFIDSVFSLGDMRGLDPKDLKNFIRDKANKKLNELGLKNNWKNIDKESLQNISWFDTLSYGISNVDFFSARVNEYIRVDWKMEDMFK